MVILLRAITAKGSTPKYWLVIHEKHKGHTSDPRKSPKNGSLIAAMSSVMAMYPSGVMVLSEVA